MKKMQSGYFYADDQVPSPPINGLVYDHEESNWGSGHHSLLPPLPPRFDLGLVRGLRLVDLNLTPMAFLQKVVSSSVLIMSLWVTTPTITTLNKAFAFFVTPTTPYIVS